MRYKNVLHKNGVGNLVVAARDHLLPELNVPRTGQPMKHEGAPGANQAEAGSIVAPETMTATVVS